MLRKFNICPNAYYNYLKDRKKAYYQQKQEVLTLISKIYHEHNGVDGYRSMRVFLERNKVLLSANTVHRYMNGELHLYSIVRRKKPAYQKHPAHKVFPNLINQNFQVPAANRFWCTDFTYLYLKDGSVRYNCTILDLHDRSIISSITDKEITSDLAIRTLDKALCTQPGIKKGLVLHSDQGSQYTSQAFVNYCKSVGITQSMSKAGYPYDNAPMERYYNTLKNELIYLHEFRTDDELNTAIEEFAYTWYNHVRPHSFNAYKTPFEARYGK